MQIGTNKGDEMEFSISDYEEYLYEYFENSKERSVKGRYE